MERKNPINNKDAALLSVSYILLLSRDAERGSCKLRLLKAKTLKVKSLESHNTVCLF
jgi:hypothetical protein